MDTGREGRCEDSRLNSVYQKGPSILFIVHIKVSIVHLLDFIVYVVMRVCVILHAQTHTY